MNNIAVVYLAFNSEGQKPMWEFFNSYMMHHAGRIHSLIVHHAREGQDLLHYRYVALGISSDYVLFLNTHTTIKAHGWLDLMMRQTESRNVNLVGSMGSWESCPNDGVSFPNPHIRTNGFLVERKKFLEISDRRFRTKGECYDFESGPGNMASRLSSIVAGADGKGYFLNEMLASRTFRLGGQENLLFSDNQTRHYDAAGPEERARLRELAWGEK